MSKYREYTIVDNDTIEGIALKTTGNVEDWRTIVAINSLDFPYIVPDWETEILAEREIPASGDQVFGLNAVAGSPITIPKGALLELTVKGIRDTSERKPRYITETSGVIPAGSTSVTIKIVCESPGTWGNTSANTITKFVERDDPNNPGQKQILLESGAWVTKPPIDFTYNPQGFFNGKTRNIKTTGDVILVPNVESTPSVQRQEDFNTFLGSDLELVNGDFTKDPRNGDLAVVSGIDNVASAFVARLETRKGELKRYPWYGSNLHVYIGRSEPYIKDLIRAEIEAVGIQDDRIESVEVLDLSILGQTINVSANIRIAGQENPIRLTNLPLSIGR